MVSSCCIQMTLKFSHIYSTNLRGVRNPGLTQIRGEDSLPSSCMWVLAVTWPGWLQLQVNYLPQGKCHAL